MSFLVIIISALAYLIGAIPFSKILASLKGIKLEEIGSKNLGATNVYRSMGIKWAVTVFILDFCKGLLPVLISIHYLENPLLHVLTGACCIVGHSLSIFVKFKGGKGVATGLGVLAALNPLTVVIIFPIAIGCIIKFRYVAPVSIASCVAAPTFLYLFDAPNEYLMSITFICLFIIIRHKKNIERMIQGKENKI